MTHVPLTDHAALDAAERTAWEAALGPLSTLERAFAWAGAQRPRLELDEILTQDEFTHDVVIVAGPHRYVVFDAT